MKTLVFDLDGTLADTGADLSAAANAVFQQLGHGDVIDPDTDATIAYNYGGRGMLRHGFARLGHDVDEATTDAHFPTLLEAYEAKIAHHTKMFPSAVEVIERLRTQGYKTAVCTNKIERLADILLRELGVRDLFDALVGADSLPVKKPDPAPFFAAVERAGGDAAQALMVGDTATDRNTAKAAGAPCILVTFGPVGDSVREFSPEALMDHYDDLPAITRRLIG